MTDSTGNAIRRIARELAEEIKDSLWCGAGDEWKHTASFEKIEALFTRELAATEKRVREECAKVAESMSSAKDNEELWTPITERIAASIRSLELKGE